MASDISINYYPPTTGTPASWTAEVGYDRSRHIGEGNDLASALMDLASDLHEALETALEDE